MFRMAVKLSFSLALAAFLLLPSQSEARAASSSNVSVAKYGCAIAGTHPGRLKGRFPKKSTVRFDLLSSSGKLLGRQIVFNGLPQDGAVLMSSEAWGLSENKQPQIECSADVDTALKPMTPVDVGPQIILHSIYLGRGSVAASFYAYEEDFFAGRKDEGLINQLFSVRLDGRSPCEVQVTAKPGEDVTVRFEGLAPGKHRLEFGEMQMGGPQLGYYTTGLYELDFTQPGDLSALR